MTGILILGAGGHAKVVADILQLQGAEVRGFLDDNSEIWDTTRLGLPVLGGIDRLAEYAPDGLILGIGSNKLRKQIVDRLGPTMQSLWRNAIHPTAAVAQSARLGHGVVLAAHAVVNPDTQIGNHVIVNTSASIDHDCTIGDYAHIAPGVRIAGGVTIATGALMGVGSSIIPRRTVGAWSVVGAGATVVHSIPDNATATGTPARW